VNNGRVYLDAPRDSGQPRYYNEPPRGYDRGYDQPSGYDRGYDQPREYDPGYDQPRGYDQPGGYEPRRNYRPEPYAQQTDQESQASGGVGTSWGTWFEDMGFGSGSKFRWDATWLMKLIGHDSRPSVEVISAMRASTGHLKASGLVFVKSQHDKLALQILQLNENNVNLTKAKAANPSPVMRIWARLNPM